jgi:hypothetical protein
MSLIRAMMRKTAEKMPTINLIFLRTVGEKKRRYLISVVIQLGSAKFGCQ